MSLAESMLAGGSHLAHLDQLREEEAGSQLRAVTEVPALETASQLLPRFTVRQCQAVVAELARSGNELDRMLGLVADEWVTMDLDSTPTEVSGRQKEDAVYDYEGRSSLGSLLCTGADRRRVIAADLTPGSGSDKPLPPGVVRRALRTLAEGHGKVRLRMDSGFYGGPFLNWCRKGELPFVIVVPRYKTMWEARRQASSRLSTPRSPASSSSAWSATTQRRASSSRGIRLSNSPYDATRRGQSWNRAASRRSCSPSPGISTTSQRSSSGSAIVDRELAVAMKSTSERSKGTPRKRSVQVPVPSSSSSKLEAADGESKLDPEFALSSSSRTRTSLLRPEARTALRIMPGSPSR